MERLSVKDVYGQALVAAAMEGNVELIQLLVASGAKVNTENQIVVSDKYEYSDSAPLLIAAGKDHKECVQALVHLGADVNKSGTHDYTPLMVAAECCKDNIDTVRFLIESGANVNARDFVDETALIKSADSSDTLKIKLLLESGADPRASSFFGQTALMHAALWGMDHIIKILIEKGASVNERKDDGVTPLMNASCLCNFGTIELLIKLGADVNATNEGGFNSLVFVLFGDEFRDCFDPAEFVPQNITSSPYVRYGNYGTQENYHTFFQPSTDIMKEELYCVNTLVSAGVDVNHEAYSGWTAVMVAALKGHVDIIKTFLKLGANVNATGLYGWSAIISALIADHHDCVKYLIESGADVNVQVQSSLSENKGPVLCKSALGFAGDIGNINTILLLLQSRVHKDGVFIYSTTKDDVKAIMEAVGACTPQKRLDSSLQNQCREAIRQHLLETVPPVNLYWKMKQLGLPSLLKHYLLYTVPAFRNLV